ncbi:Acg family FMN-binding oxidoreductase [Streptomyces sp. NPDC047928]|uniref:Acg family FMN-binding oxidoreductase n=1 Tax=unclassified Streptomyces TaxID=2593676 RepID=UPI00371499A6
MPSRTLDVATVTSLVADAVTAPSMHNAQPWLFRHVRGSDTLRLRMDPARTMPRADPTHRGLYVGCAAALFNLRVAAAHGGWATDVASLPDPADPELLAEVRFTGDGAPDEALAALYPALRRRRTNRSPFSDEPVPDEIRDELGGAALAEGARLVFLGSWQTSAVLELVRDAEYAEALAPELQREIAHWTRGDDDASRAEGIPAYAFGPHQYNGHAPVRDFAAHAPLAGRPAATFEREPCLAVLGTREDRPVDWLTAGQAMERVLLQATLDGLSTTLNSHALEWPELRWAARDPLTSMGHVQMLIRFGYGPEVPATPRRPVSEVLDVSDGG